MKIYFSYEHIPEMSDIPVNARYKTWREFSRVLGFFASLWRGMVVFFAFMIPYSNGYLHYGAPASYYDKGGYEVTECLLAPEWQGIYEQKANEIISRLQ